MSEMLYSNEYRRAIRMTFEYGSQQISLLSAERLNMKVPPSDRYENVADQCGFWLDIKSASKKTIFRRILDNPLSGEWEGFSEEPSRPYFRMVVDNPKGTFAVLIPDLSKGKTVRLVEVSHRDRSMSPVERELGSFKLSDAIG